MRVALNPFVSSAGFELPNLISGFTVISIVLSLPMHGPLLLRPCNRRTCISPGRSSYPQYAYRCWCARLGHCPGVARSPYPVHVGRKADEPGRQTLPESPNAYHHAPTQNAAAPAATETKVAVASQWQLMRWRFKKHKLAVISMCIIAIFLFVGVFCEFLAPAEPDKTAEIAQICPSEGNQLLRSERPLSLIPGVYGLTGSTQPGDAPAQLRAGQDAMAPDRPVCARRSVQVLGSLVTGRASHRPQECPAGYTSLPPGHGPAWGGTCSRVSSMARGSRSRSGLSASSSVLILGVLLGGISGYYGGAADVAIQRVIEFVRSLPQIPLWLALAASLPPGWSSDTRLSS